MLEIYVVHKPQGLKKVPLYSECHHMHINLFNELFLLWLIIAFGFACQHFVQTMTRKEYNIGFILFHGKMGTRDPARCDLEDWGRWCAQFCQRFHHNKPQEVLLGLIWNFYQGRCQLWSCATYIHSSSFSAMTGALHFFPTLHQQTVKHYLHCQLKWPAMHWTPSALLRRDCHARSLLQLTNARLQVHIDEIDDECNLHLINNK